MARARIDLLSRIRAGTEGINLEYWCAYCEDDMRAGGIKICFDNFSESLCICSNCMKVGKIQQSRRKTN